MSLSATFAGVYQFQAGAVSFKPVGFSIFKAPRHKITSETGQFLCESQPMSMSADPVAEFVTAIGESAVLGALVAVAAIFFFLSRCPREAVAMLLSFAVAGAVIGILKIAFLSCGHGVLGIRSPSGHAALAVSVFGTYALILFRRSTAGHHYILPVFLFVLGLVIALTRVSLDFHSAAEVVLGMIVGLCTIAALRVFVLAPDSRSRDHAKAPFNTPLLIALTGLTAVSVYGTRIPVETAIRSFAESLKAFFPGCS